jgi:hypothetical protein
VTASLKSRVVEATGGTHGMISKLLEAALTDFLDRLDRGEEIVFNKPVVFTPSAQAKQRAALGQRAREAAQQARVRK